MSKKWDGPQVGSEYVAADAQYLRWKEIVDRMAPLLTACREGKATAAQLSELENLREQVLALNTALKVRSSR